MHEADAISPGDRIVDDQKASARMARTVAQRWAGSRLRVRVVAAIAIVRGVHRAQVRFACEARLYGSAHRLRAGITRRQSHSLCGLLRRPARSAASQREHDRLQLLTCSYRSPHQFSINRV